METTATFEINEIGTKTGNPYNGSFKVKTLLTRREEFTADELRRAIIGANPDAVPPSLSGEAFMHGQLQVRIIDCPKWWEDAGMGLDLPDLNVVVAVFQQAIDAEKKREKEIQKASEEALKKIKKTAK